MRSGVLDICKGLGIIFVVYAHASGPFGSYLEHFHMPLFFLISGYLFSERDFLLTFVKKRLKRLYIPFAFWNILAIIVTFVTGVQARSLAGLVKHIVFTLVTVDKDGQFFGASWFLAALFVISVTYKLLDAYYRVLPSGKRALFLVLLYLMFAVVGIQITFPHEQSRVLVCGFFYAFGRLVKTYQKELVSFDTPALTVVSFAFFLLTCWGGTRVYMGGNEYTFPVLFFMGALAGSYATLGLSRAIHSMAAGKGNCLQWLGRHSMDILLFQFVMFRVVIAVQLLVEHRPLSLLLKYYPTYKAADGWWLLYTVVGVFGSIAIVWLLGQKPWGSRLKRLCIIS